MKNIYLILILAFLAGCRQNAENDQAGYLTNQEIIVADEIMPITRRQNAGPQGQHIETPSIITENIHPKKVIKDGRLSIDVKDIYIAKRSVDSLTVQNKGYISRENFNNYSYAINFSLTIRLPANSFEKFITDLENGTGEITSKNINTRDVTEEFIDLEKRLENKKKYDKQYSELLKQARTIKDILAIQEKQRVIQEEIESTEGRLKYLKDQVSFSTLNLELNQKIKFKYKPKEKDKFLERFWQSIHKGWQVFIDFLLFLFKLWPFWIAGILIWRLIRKIRRKKEINK